MITEQDSADPDVQPENRSKVYAGLAVLALILGLLTWDLLPALHMQARLRELDRICATGTNWSDAEPILLARGYRFVTRRPLARGIVIDTRGSFIGLALMKLAKGPLEQSPGKMVILRSFSYPLPVYENDTSGTITRKVPIPPGW